MNFTYYDPKKIANSDPTKPAQDDNFYILGSSKQLPEDLAKDYSNGSEKGQELENLKDALSKIGLLPSQNSNTIPPIVLLTSGDILIQKPEDYSAEAISKLAKWDKSRKIFLKIDNSESIDTGILAEIIKNPKIVKIIENKSENLGIIDGKNKGFEAKKLVDASKEDNIIKSENSETTLELQNLRALQQVLGNKDILTINLNENRLDFNDEREEKLNNDKVKPKSEQAVQNVGIVPAQGGDSEEKPKKLIILDANKFNDVAQFVEKILDCKLDERILFINLNKNIKSQIKEKLKELPSGNENYEQPFNSSGRVLDLNEQLMERHLFLPNSNINLERLQKIDAKIGIGIHEVIYEGQSKNLTKKKEKLASSIDPLSAKNTPSLESYFEKPGLLNLEGEERVFSLNFLQKMDKEIEETDRREKENAETQINFDLKGDLTKTAQVELVSSIFESLANEKIAKKEDEYVEDFNAWSNSQNDRYRLVIVEATNFSTEHLAQTIINSKPIERVLLVNLTPSKQDELKEALEKQVKEKYPNNLHEFSGEKSCKDLMGPHLFLPDLNINLTNLKKIDSSFDANLEELCCIGKSSELPKNVLKLSNSIKDIPFLTICTDTDTTENWMYSIEDSDKKDALLTSLTSAKDSESIIQNTEIPLIQANSDCFTRFNTASGNSDLLKNSDINFLKSALFTEVLAPAYTSPNELDLANSSAASIVGVKKAKEVSKVIGNVLWGDYSVSATELKFAVANMLRDGGSDQIKERSDMLSSYRTFFNNTQVALIDNGKTLKEATTIALNETIDLYLDIEKFNKNIHNLINHTDNGAKAWRNYGIEYSNKVKNANEKGLKILKVAPILFATSIVAEVVGYFSFMAALKNIFPVLQSALTYGSVGSSTGVTGKSMFHQIAANKKYLTHANIALAEANMKFTAAQAERNHLIEERTKEVIKEIKTTTPEVDKTKHKNLNESLYIADIPEEKTFQPGLTLKGTRNLPYLKLQNNKNVVTQPFIKGEDSITTQGRENIFKKTEEIIKQDNDKGFLGEIDTTAEVAEKYARDILTRVAQRELYSLSHDYQKDVDLWKESASSRSRLVIIEATSETDFKILAEAIYSAAALDRVLVVGLDDDQKDKLTEGFKEYVQDKLSALKGNEREEFKGRILKVTGQEIGDTSQDINFNNTSLNQFFGPHIHQEKLTINSEFLKEKYPEFEVNIEEVLLYANSEELAVALNPLGLALQEDGVPTLSIKSKEFTNEYTGEYECCGNNENSLLNTVTACMSAKDILGVTTRDGTKTYENVTISPVYQNQFAQLQGQNDEAIVLLKDLIFDNALFEANMSPKRSTVTISKGSSKKDAQAGVNVADSLIYNLILYPKNLATEAEEGCSFVVNDSGVDSLKENMAKRIAYREFFCERLQEHRKNHSADSSETPVKKASEDFIKLYHTIKGGSEINSLEKEAMTSRQASYTLVDKAKNSVRKLDKNKLKSIAIIAITGTIIGAATFAASLALGGLPFIPLIAIAAVGTTLVAAKLITLRSTLNKIKFINAFTLGSANKLSKKGSELYSTINKKRINIINEEKTRLKKEDLSRGKTRSIKNNVDKDKSLKSNQRKGNGI